MSEHSREPADSTIATVRRLASRFDASQLECCVKDELSMHENVCVHEGPHDEFVAELAKAEFVRKQVDHGVAPRDAIRELARRIRAVQRGSTEDA
jgi:hypothetical protein